MVDKDAVGYAPDHPAVQASLEAMALEKRGWEAMRDECYAWLGVRKRVDPGLASNVGKRHISWTLDRGRPIYRIHMRGPWGFRSRRYNAPPSLEEARTSPMLATVIDRRDEMRAELVADYGESSKVQTVGLGDQIRLILSVTPIGRERLEIPTAVHTIKILASTAAAYECEGWNPQNVREVHVNFRAHPDRHNLIRHQWTAQSSREEVAKQYTTPPRPDPFRPLVPVRAHVRGSSLPEDLKLKLRLAYESGVTLPEVVAFWKSLAKSELGGAVAA